MVKTSSNVSVSKSSTKTGYSKNKIVNSNKSSSSSKSVINKSSYSNTSSGKVSSTSNKKSYNTNYNSSYGYNRKSHLSSSSNKGYKTNYNSYSSRTQVYRGSDGSVTKVSGGYSSRSNSSIKSIKTGSMRTNGNSSYYRTSSNGAYQSSNYIGNPYSNVSEKVDLKKLSNQKVSVDDIDLSRISGSAYGAQNGEFVNVNPKIWSAANLIVTERDDGTYLIKNGDVPIGFTDKKGLEALYSSMGIKPSSGGSDSKGDNSSSGSTPKEEVDLKDDDKPSSSESVGSGTPYSGSSGGGFTLSGGDELETVYKIIAAEGGNISPDEAVNIASTMINRARAGNWGSTDIYDLATAPNQYVVYQEGLYRNQTLSEDSRAAVDELFASCAEGGETPHDYQSFRSNGSSSYGGTILVPGGNRYK